MECSNGEIEIKQTQNLCIKCGLCCRIVLPSASYDKIKQQYKAGNKSAISFLKMFEPYESIEEAKKVSKEFVEIVIENRNKKVYPDEKEIILFKCKYINDDNLCTNYDNRPLNCRKFPKDAWVDIPNDCGFYGKSFIEKETVKLKIRKMKEKLLELELLKSTNNNLEVITKINAVEHKIDKEIKSYKHYGSKNW